MKPNIYHYLNYRLFLKDFYCYLNDKSGLSYRKFSKLCGSSLPSFLQLLLKGKARVNLRQADKVCTGLKLNKAECKHFLNLIGIDNAKTFEEKEQFFSLALKAKTKKTQYKIEKNQLQYYSKWFYSSIWALLGYYDFNPKKDSFAKLGKQFQPTLSAQNVSSAIKLLKNLKLLKLNKASCLKPVANHLTTGPNPSSMLIKKYQLESGKKALDAINSLDHKLLEFSTLTSYISEEGFNTIKEEIIKTRKRIIDIVSNDSNEDRVYQLNLQFFPVTKIKK